MLRKILLILGVLIAGLLIVIAMQPSEYQVTRSTTISAPVADVYALVNDFHNWDSWSPWAKLDPAMKKNYEGAPAGPGAIYTWAGNNQVGEGRMTINDSQPNDKVGIKLEFLKPFASTSLTAFTLKPAGDAVTVNWSMTGQNNFMAKAFGLFMGGMDKMIGPDFDKGLAQMKSVAEARARK